MSRARTSPGLVDAQVQRLGRVGVHLERDLLQVEDDVGRILDHARDRRELVQHAVDLHRRDRRPFDRGEQHAAQRVTDRRAEAALERLRVEAPEPVGEGLALEFEPLGPLKTFPQHVLSTFGRTPCRATAGPALTPASRRRSGKARGHDGYPADRCCRAASRSAYFEYNSTINCSWTGRLICSRVGSEAMRPDIVPASNDSHSGTPRPFTSSSACWMAGFFALARRTPTTSPASPGRTGCRPCGR